MYYLPDQLQNFESIIDETQSQFEQFEKLKVEIQKMKRILFSFKLSNMLKNKILDISHVEVVVYRSVFDVEEMTNESITIENPEDYRFISIELFIPKFLLSIFVENNFRVCMSVYHGKSTVSKSFSLNESTAVRAIIPIKESVLNCDVELLVFGKIHGKIITLKIPTVKIDISYYLVSDYAKEKGKIHKQSKKLAKIFTLYNTNCDKHVMKEYYLKYQILNSLSQQCLLEKLLKNCYTYINLSRLIFDEQNTLRIQNQDLKTFITYNNETKIIQIEANLSNLHFIKNYVNSELGIKADSEKIKIKKLASFDTCEYEDNQINTYKALRTLLS